MTNCERKLGDKQVKELMRSARCTVFFVADDRRVTLLNIGHTEALRRHARELGADVTAFDYRRRWNLDKNGSQWIVTPGSVEQVACIHACPGQELDYAGVIIGPDLAYRDGRFVTDATKRATADQSVKGLKAKLKADPGSARTLAGSIVKNTYRMLMTRGMKGCYGYCTDAPLAAYLRSRERSVLRVVPAAAPAHNQEAVPPATSRTPSNVVPLRRVTKEERDAGVVAAPDRPAFRGRPFSEAQSLDCGPDDWVAPPDWVRPQPGLFVAQMVGESMNCRVSNGARCRFRANPTGTRQGKVVVAQYRSIADPETGGRYTVKLYASEKVANEDGGCRHERIRLQPDSDRAEFEAVEHLVGDGDDV